VLELVHGDLYGKILPLTPMGNQYFLLMVDDKSRFMFIALLPSKDQALEAIKDFHLRAEVETKSRLGGLRTDHGREFNSASFLEYYRDQGMQKQLMTAYSPQQNGVVEHHNAPVVGAARSMLKAKGLLNWFWGEAVLPTVYVLNKTLTKSIDGATPFEVCYGKKPSVHHLRVFGALHMLGIQDPIYQSLKIMVRR
jgi:IS30 family transposase